MFTCVSTGILDTVDCQCSNYISHCFVNKHVNLKNIFYLLETYGA